MDTGLTTYVVLGAIALGLVTALVAMVRSLIVICLPNEMVVITGRRRTLEDGRAVGYRVLHGGRTLRIPVIEKVSRIDLRTIPIEVVVKNAYPRAASHSSSRASPTSRSAPGSRFPTTPSSGCSTSRSTRSCRSPRTRSRATCAACWPR
jgi:hypothetical protein